MTSSADTPTASAAPAAPTDPAALRAEIEETRADLADTVEALAAKLDVKAQVGSAIDSAKDRVRARAGRVTGRVRRIRQPHASVVRDPTGLAADLDPADLDPEELYRDDLYPEDLTIERAVERRRVTRSQSIVAAGIAGLVLVAVAVWAARRARR